MNWRLVAITGLTALLCVGGIVVGLRKSEFAPVWLSPVLKAPRVSGELVILTLRGPTTTESIPKAGVADDQAQTGFEHDLATLFAKELGVVPVFKVMPSYQRLLSELEKNRGHLAAAGLSPSAELRTKFAFSPSYKSVQYQLVYNDAEKTPDSRPRKLSDLVGKKVAVIAETPAHDILRDLTGTYPGFSIEVLPHEASTDELLRTVTKKKADLALVDTFGFAVAKRTYPDLASSINVGREARVAWAFSAMADYDLQRSSVLFFEKIRNNGTLNRLMDRYYGHINRIQPVDSEALLERLQTHLPKLKPYFHEAQQVTGIDWRLLAAVGYQESHWEPLATSGTGVRGLMMLTEETADRMNVKNRLDARESILGGAKYIVLLRDTVPIRIPEPDRTWLALAAYNQGYGHLEDARILTAKLGLNADSWLDVRKAYPKLREPEFYEQAKHGFCRGDEAVQLVENIRNYHDILNKLEKPLELDKRYDLLLDDSKLARPFRLTREPKKP